MSYRACFHCELLFESDSDAPCPQCGRALQPYEHDGSMEATAPAPAPARRRAPVDDMVPVSRSDWPEAVDGGRRSGYGDRDRRAPEYRARNSRDAAAAEGPSNRALPTGGGRDERRHNTGQHRLGRSSSPGARNEWRSNRANRNTREVELKGPSSPKAPRGATKDPARRSRSGGGTRTQPRPDPRSLPPAPPRPAAPAPDGMESTRMLSAIDLARGGSSADPGSTADLERTHMVSPIDDAALARMGGGAPAHDGMESTRMLSAIDLARGAPAGGAPAGGAPAASAGDLERTHMVSPITDDMLRRAGRPPNDDERTMMRPAFNPPARQAPDDDERTIMRPALDLPANRPAPAPFPSPTPRGGGGFPSPTPRGGGGGGFPSPTPRGDGGDAFPSPTPRGGGASAGPSPFPSPTPRGGGFPSPTPRGAASGAPPPVASAAPTPIAPATPAPVAPASPPPATPSPVPAPAAGGQDGARRTRALPIPGAVPGPAPATPQPVVAAIPQPVAAAVPTPVAPATPKPVTPATPKPIATPAPAASDSAPDYRDKYGSYFDARGAGGAQLTDALGAIIGEEQSAPVEPISVAPRRRRRRRSVLVWIVPVALFVVAMIVVAIFYERDPKPGEEDVAAEVVEEEATVESVATELGVRLPEAKGSDPLRNGPFIAAGADGLRLWGEQRVLGINSYKVPDHAIVESPEGDWIRSLRDTLAKTDREDLDLLALAFDDRADARAVALFANTAKKAGFDAVGLVVRRTEAGGGLGLLEFVPGKGRVPSAGAALIRVGKLSVTVRIEARDGKPLGDGDVRVDNADGQIDLDALDLLLEKVAKAHPLVRMAILQVTGDRPLGDLTALIERARIGVDKERFTRIQLVVR